MTHGQHHCCDGAGEQLYPVSAIARHTVCIRLLAAHDKLCEKVLKNQPKHSLDNGHKITQASEILSRTCTFRVNRQPW